MILAENRLKVGMREGRRMPGYWLTLASPTATEIASGSGFEWLLIDMEHTPNDLSEVVEHMRAAAAGGDAEPVVRVPSNDPVIVKRLLDSGVRSLMFPYVQSAQEARRAVAATRYPPNGTRGYAGHSRATNFGRFREYAGRASENICTILQVETPEAVANIPEMAAVEGVDCIFIGPNDLAANRGYLGRSSAPEVKAMILEALALIRAAGVSAGILNYDPPEATAMFEAGFGVIAVGGDSSMLTKAADALAASFK
jgi:4-hydroxy-2-oxoheptanedioate aldolase